MTSPEPLPLRPLAVVTGASSGIGLELARCCARARHDLVVAADEPAIEAAAHGLRGAGVRVDAVQCDLATPAGVDALWAAVAGRPVDALLANAGTGLGGPFLDAPFPAQRHVLDTNVTGLLDLVHRAGREMRARGRGRMLITGSIAGFVPGPLNSVYNATKAFIDCFAPALRNELAPFGVTVTCLMPGATDTPFFERAGMSDTALARSATDDPAEVARTGFEAMQEGRAEVISGGLLNKLQAAVAHVAPPTLMAAAHRQLAKNKPGR